MAARGPPEEEYFADSEREGTGAETSLSESEFGSGPQVSGGALQPPPPAHHARRQQYHQRRGTSRRRTGNTGCIFEYLTATEKLLIGLLFLAFFLFIVRLMRDR